MKQGQLFKSVYFPDYNDSNRSGKAFTLAFGDKHKGILKNIAPLTSQELRNLLGTHSFVELEQRATREGLPVNTYCLWYLKKNLVTVEPEKIATKISLHQKLNKIICGDVLETMQRLPPHMFDTIIIDPPYNIGKDFGNNNDRREMTDYLTWADQWIKESFRVLKPTGTIYIYGFSEILSRISARIPLEQQRWLVWHYTNKNVASLNFWQRSHESILCLWKDKKIFNRDLVREPYTEGFLQGAAGKTRKDTVGRFSKGGKTTVYNAHKNGALPRDVIKVAALAGGAGMIERWFFCKTCKAVYEPRQLLKHQNHRVIKHPTQKPLALTRKLLQASLPSKKASVLVPFSGSGSECVVARELGAQYLGIELNPDYVKLANGFLAKY